MMITLDHTEQEIKILKELFAIPGQDAWKWRVTVYEDGAIGIGRISKDEIKKEKMI